MTNYKLISVNKLIYKHLKKRFTKSVYFYNIMLWTLKIHLVYKRHSNEIYEEYLSVTFSLNYTLIVNSLLFCRFEHLKILY